MTTMLNITPRPISILQGEVWGRERDEANHTLLGTSAGGKEKAQDGESLASAATGVHAPPQTQHYVIW